MRFKQYLGKSLSISGNKQYEPTVELRASPAGWDEEVNISALRLPGKVRVQTKRKKASHLKKIIQRDVEENRCTTTAPQVLRVRRYVHQYLSQELDEITASLLRDLARFQERAKQTPEKFKKNKRYVIGLRETMRALHQGKLMGLVIAPNCTSSESIGGLDESLGELFDLAEAGVQRKQDEDLQPIPIVFALSRNRIGKALNKNMRQSVVGLLSTEGAFDTWRKAQLVASTLRDRWLTDSLNGAIEKFSLLDNADVNQNSEEPRPTLAQPKKIENLLEQSENIQ